MKTRVQTLVTPQGGLDFTVIHRPRVTRRLHLELDAQGELLVVVPPDWPDFYTRRLLRENLTYVHRFLRRARERRLPPLTYQDGSRHLYQGRPLSLRLEACDRRGAESRLQDDELTFTLSEPTPERVRNALRRWYRTRASELFAERLHVMKARAPWAKNRTLSLKLRRMKRTWGTCRQDGVIRLNTHLVKAPVDCLDYVLSHELCHLEEMNHGPRFYALQESLWPRWREYRRHLRDRGGRYTQE